LFSPVKEHTILHHLVVIKPCSYELNKNIITLLSDNEGITGRIYVIRSILLKILGQIDDEGSVSKNSEKSANSFSRFKKVKLFNEKL
jgi:hypothetical protein